MPRLTLISLLTIIFLPPCISAQPDSGYFASFDKAKIYYQVAGTGQPVLLIHGFTGKGSDWKRRPVYDSLLSHGFKVITADLRGGGLSDKPHDYTAYANDAEAKDLMGLMTHLGIKNYKAIGYSRGSIILARLLVLDKRLTRAVIGGMGADFTNPEWPRRIGIYNALINDTVSGYADFRNRIETAGLDKLALAYQQKEQPSTSPKELSTIKQPVLIICGDQDTDNGRGEDLQKLIPGSKFVNVPGNHGAASGTKEFAAKAVEFLNNRQ